MDTKDRLAVILFYLLLVLNLILFGGPHHVTRVISLVISLFLLGLIRDMVQVKGEWLWTILIIISIFQLIPLPEQVLKMVSPATYTLRILPLHQTGLSLETLWRPISAAPVETMFFLSTIFTALVIYSVSYLYIPRSIFSLQQFFKFLLAQSLFIILTEIVNKISGTHRIYGFTLERKTPFGEFINPNFASTVMAMSLLVFLNFSLNRTKKENKITGILLSGIIYAGIILTLSRSVIIYTSLLVIFLIISSIQPEGNRREKIILASLIVLVILYDIFNLDLTPLIKKFDVLSLSLRARKDLINSTAKIFLHSPVTGIGFGGMHEAFHFFTIPARLSIPYDDFDLLQILAEGGIISFILVTVFIWWNYKIERERKNNLPAIYQRYITGLDLALILFILHSFFAYVFFFPYTHFMMASILGVRNGILYRKFRRKNSWKRI